MTSCLVYQPFQVTHDLCSLYSPSIRPKVVLHIVKRQIQLFKFFVSTP